MKIYLTLTLCILLTNLSGKTLHISGVVMTRSLSHQKLNVCNDYTIHVREAPSKSQIKTKVVENQYHPEYIRSCEIAGNDKRVILTISCFGHSPKTNLYYIESKGMDYVVNIDTVTLEEVPTPSLSDCILKTKPSTGEIRYDLTFKNPYDTIILLKNIKVSFIIDTSSVGKGMSNASHQTFSYSIHDSLYLLKKDSLWSFLINDKDPTGFWNTLTGKLGVNLIDGFWYFELNCKSDGFIDKNSIAIFRYSLPKNLYLDHNPKSSIRIDQIPTRKIRRFQIMLTLSLNGKNVDSKYTCEL